jgi:vacuolar-type H+-ATPase subunit H
VSGDRAQLSDLFVVQLGIFPTARSHRYPPYFKGCRRCDIEILQLVDQLENVLNKGWRIPFTPSLIVNSEECLRLIDQMRISVPSAIKESERMIAERDKILDRAQTQADEIVADAQDRAREIISERGIASAAEEEARQIMAMSRAEANRIMQEAEDYVTQVLQQLSSELETMLRQAENGIQTIQESRGQIEAMSLAAHDVSTTDS